MDEWFLKSFKPPTRCELARLGGGGILVLGRLMGKVGSA